MGEETEIDPTLKKTNLFLKVRRTLEGFPSRKKRLLHNSRRLPSLADTIASGCDGQRSEESLEESKGFDSSFNSSSGGDTNEF